VQLVENAVSIPDDTTDRLCKAAKAAHINVVIGMDEKNSETSNAIYEAGHKFMWHQLGIKVLIGWERYNILLGKVVFL